MLTFGSKTELGFANFNTMTGDAAIAKSQTKIEPFVLDNAPSSITGVLRGFVPTGGIARVVVPNKETKQETMFMVFAANGKPVAISERLKRRSGKKEFGEKDVLKFAQENNLWKGLPKFVLDPLFRAMIPPATDPNAKVLAEVFVQNNISNIYDSENVKKTVDKNKNEYLVNPDPIVNPEGTKEIVAALKIISTLVGNIPEEEILDIRADIEVAREKVRRQLENYPEEVAAEIMRETDEIYQSFLSGNFDPDVNKFFDWVEFNIDTMELLAGKNLSPEREAKALAVSKIIQNTPLDKELRKEGAQLSAEFGGIFFCFSKELGHFTVDQTIVNRPGQFNVLENVDFRVKNAYKEFKSVFYKAKEEGSFTEGTVSFDKLSTKNKEELKRIAENLRSHFEEYEIGKNYLPSGLYVDTTDIEDPRVKQFIEENKSLSYNELLDVLASVDGNDNAAKIGAEKLLERFSIPEISPQKLFAEPYRMDATFGYLATLERRALVGDDGLYSKKTRDDGRLVVNYRNGGIAPYLARALSSGSIDPSKISFSATKGYNATGPVEDKGKPRDLHVDVFYSIAMIIGGKTVVPVYSAPTVVEKMAYAVQQLAKVSKDSSKYKTIVKKIKEDGSFEEEEVEKAVDIDKSLEKISSILSEKSTERFVGKLNTEQFLVDIEEIKDMDGKAKYEAVWNLIQTPNDIYKPIIEAAKKVDVNERNNGDRALSFFVNAYPKSASEIATKAREVVKGFKEGKFEDVLKTVKFFNVPGIEKLDKKKASAVRKLAQKLFRKLIFAEFIRRELIQDIYAEGMSDPYVAKYIEKKELTGEAAFMAAIKHNPNVLSSERIMSVLNQLYMGYPGSGRFFHMNAYQPADGITYTKGIENIDGVEREVVVPISPEEMKGIFQARTRLAQEKLATVKEEIYDSVVEAQIRNTPKTQAGKGVRAGGTTLKILEAAGLAKYESETPPTEEGQEAEAESNKEVLEKTEETVEPTEETVEPTEEVKSEKDIPQEEKPRRRGRPRKSESAEEKKEANINQSSTIDIEKGDTSTQKTPEEKVDIISDDIDEEPVKVDELFGAFFDEEGIDADDLSGIFGVDDNEEKEDEAIEISGVIDEDEDKIKQSIKP